MDSELESNCVDEDIRRATPIEEITIKEAVVVCDNQQVGTTDITLAPFTREKCSKCPLLKCSIGVALVEGEYNIDYSSSFHTRAI